MAKNKWKKMIVAGSLVVEAVYPAVPSRGTDKVRGAKRKLSSEAQRRMNLVYSKQKLKLILAANFNAGDVVCTLTYDKGDVRVRDELARFVDVDPWPGMATRQSWMNWIITQLLGDGDGEAFVLPRTSDGKFAALEPMPGAVTIDDAANVYAVQWRGRVYMPDEVLHFRLYTDPERPWKGRGVRVQAKQLAASLATTALLKDKLNSPDYKPPMVIAVNSDNAFSDEEERERFRES